MGEVRYSPNSAPLAPSRSWTLAAHAVTVISDKQAAWGLDGDRDRVGWVVAGVGEELE
ncbi:hypothetical protein GCM10010177_35180 [Actinomadura citrea]|nr:hypothetical protein GCM10010177_35180 [Actinomadura citrea]